MTRHDRKNIRFNRRPVNHSIRSVPILDRKIVDSRDKVLVPLITAVAWKVFRSSGHSVRLTTPYVIDDTVSYHFGIGTIGTGVCYRITEVQIYVGYRGKSPIYAKSGSFPATDIPQVSRLFQDRARPQSTSGNGIVWHSGATCLRSCVLPRP
jgi:hypothetical protein